MFSSSAVVRIPFEMATSTVRTRMRTRTAVGVGSECRRIISGLQKRQLRCRVLPRADHHRLTTSHHRHHPPLLSSSSPFRIASMSSSVTTAGIKKTEGCPKQKMPPNSMDQRQLCILAFRTGIPMIAFGIMDNVVMITAGEAIDSTFGVALGISTMAAAGLGQCCSDVAGLTSGGLVDAAVSKLNLPQHRLSPKQLDSRRARMYSTFGACVGVVTGCLIGMSVLLL